MIFLEKFRRLFQPPTGRPGRLPLTENLRPADPLARRRARLSRKYGGRIGVRAMVTRYTRRGIPVY